MTAAEVSSHEDSIPKIIVDISITLFGKNMQYFVRRNIMKKIFAVLLILGFAVTAVCADDFPTGKWLDENWNGIWEFEVGNSVKLMEEHHDCRIYNYQHH